jgi:MFS family permease
VSSAENSNDRSYRALLAVPSVGRLLLGMQIARIGQSMVSVAIVLFTLAAYKSIQLAGLAAFFVLFPGLIVSPIAGALLDRHGRTRLVVLDYLVALAALTLIGVLAVAGALPGWELILIAAIASLTTPLSGTGLRSLFPLIVPSHLWERVNAVDSTGYVIATIVGPPLAAFIVAVWGGPVACIVIASSFGLAALVLIGVPDPPATQSDSTAPLLVAARQGLVYTWHNRTLRGLGFSLSFVNITTGTLNIVVPLIVLGPFRLNETVVGLVLALQGLAGIASAFFFGRIDSRNRERMMLIVPMLGTGLALAMLLVKSNLTVLILVMITIGLLNGPLDIALFTLRQRRTHRSWTGRAFAVSMAFNALGIPIGSALAGILAARSLDAAIAVGVGTALSSAAIAALMIPARE